MTAVWTPRTVVQAIEDAAASNKTGYRFLDEGEGGTVGAAGAEPFFTHAGVERASARFGGALQALGAGKGDRVALILPDNADFVFAFLGAIRAGAVPVPIYPPTGLGKLAG
jgi:fatty-acyl-CoA synthase